MFYSGHWSALENSELLATDIHSYFEHILASRHRTTQPMRKIAKFCCTEPAFTADMLERNTGVARATAYRIVDELVNAGILREENIKVRGQKVWSSPAMLKALDDFAERAGRRQFGK